MCDDPRLCFCPCSKYSSPWRDNKNIFIHHDHGCKATAMTPQELLKHLKTAGDSTHGAIFVCACVVEESPNDALNSLDTFCGERRAVEIDMG